MVIKIKSVLFVYALIVLNFFALLIVEKNPNQYFLYALIVLNFFAS
jgi:hypothetical protein